MSDRFNAISLSEVLPSLFEKKEHFSKEEYYNEMISICPELKKKWYEKIPSEEKIQKMIIEECGYGVVDGKDSVPSAEKALGIKIDPEYTYPRGMSDFEYNMEHFYKYGLFNCFQESDKGRENCFDRWGDANGETHYARKPDKKRAYQQAWTNLHYPDREAVKKSMQNDWNELCELNPELKEVKFDKENMALLGMARAGVTYGFPKEDIELFLNEYGKGNTGRRHRDRIKAELKEAGLPEDFSPEWVPSSKTIKKMGELYKIAQQEKAKEQQRDNLQEKQPESGQDIVAHFRAGGGIKVIDKGVLNRSLDDNQMEKQNKATQSAVLTAFNRQKSRSV